MARVISIGVVDEGRDHAQEYKDCTAVTQRCTLFMYSHPLPPRVYHEEVLLLLLEPVDDGNGQPINHFLATWTKTRMLDPVAAAVASAQFGSALLLPIGVVVAIVGVVVVVVASVGYNWVLLE